MRTGRKKLGLLLAVIMFVSVFAVLASDVKTSAANEVGTPKISVKRINSGTGAKITIGKTKGAAAYFIYITNIDNAYSEYMRDNGKYDREIGIIRKDGTKKRTFTIKGLPKGKYTFKVMAADDVWDNRKYSAEKTVKIKAVKTKNTKDKSYDFSKAKVGDIIEFGSYEQDANMKNGKEAIEWIVLSKDENQIFVVSKYALDTLPYDKEYANCEDITWENSSLREWLNEKFYKTAFNVKERKMIKNTKLTNAGNKEYNTLGGNDTEDNVFLLSIDDVKNTKYGFSSDCYENDIARRCTPTAYAVVMGAMEWSDEDSMTKDGKNSCAWWLRSSGTFKGSVTEVLVSEVEVYGAEPYNDNRAVRPALYINLN